MTYRIRAAFILPGARGWQWITWTAESDGNMHAAILAKRDEIGAVAWDFGQADYYPISEWPAGR